MCGKDATNDVRTMPCEIRPIAVDTPQNAFSLILFKGDTFFLEQGVLIQQINSFMLPV